MIFQLYIFKDNTWQGLDLPSDFNLGLVQNSGFLGKIQSGSFSFTSTLPTTQNNCTILQNAENPQMVLDRKIQFPAKLLVGSTEYYTWYFVLRRANEKQYSFDLIQTPGNQPRTFYDLKLWQLDFGKLELAGIPKKSGIFSLNLYGDNQIRKLLFSPEPVLFEIWINGQLIAHSPLSGKFVDAKWYWVKNENDTETRFFRATKDTDYNIIIHEEKKGYGSLNISMLNNKPVNSAIIRIYKSSITFNNQNFNVNKGESLGNFAFEECTYKDVTNELSTIANNQENYPFKFISYNSDNYYPSGNKEYEGIVNQYGIAQNSDPDDPTIVKKLLVNNNLDYVRYAISPCFSLKFILEKIAEMMGFTLVSDVFQNKTVAGVQYLGDLHLINNCDLSRST